MMSLFRCVRKQLPESDGNDEATLEKGDTNPLDVSLEDIAENLFPFLNGVKSLQNAKKDIEKKYEIKKEFGDCWSADDIKRVWGQTQSMNTKSSKKRYWAHVIILQMLKRYMAYGCKLDTAHHNTTNENKQSCETRPGMKENSEDRVIQSISEPQQTKQDKDTAEQPSGAKSTATERQSTDNTGSESLTSTSGKRDDLKESPRKDDGKEERKGSNKLNNSQTVYIRIPFSVMSGNESPSSTDTVVPNDASTYKLIDRVPNLTEIRKRKSYAVLYDNRTRNAAWVYEILNSETLKKEIKRKNVYKEDQSIHPFYRPSEDTYQSPYHRGHLLAANHHKWCREACDDTFLMSNISPQHGGLNRGKWKTLEDKCRSEALNSQLDIRNVHVYSGPLYLPTDNNSRVVYEEIKTQAVPTHFFKVIIKEHEDDTVKLECYMMPNEKLDPNIDYTVSIEDIERASGVIFRESGCGEGETDSLREVIWTGHNDDDKPCSVTTKVNISTPRME